MIEDRGGSRRRRDVSKRRGEKGETARTRTNEERKGQGEGKEEKEEEEEEAAGSAALIKLAEDNEPVCRLACLAV